MKAYACILIAIGVAAGAFGAHGLKELVTPERLEVFKTASHYQIMMSTLLLILAREESLKSWVLKLLCFGIIVFSFSLYLLVLLDKPMLGAITPIGGASLIIAISFCAYQIKTNN